MIRQTLSNILTDRRVRVAIDNNTDLSAPHWLRLPVGRAQAWLFVFLTYIRKAEALFLRRHLFISSHYYLLSFCPPKETRISASLKQFLPPPFNCTRTSSSAAKPTNVRVGYYFL